jgi:class 3 adenylate cyclase
VEYKPLESGTVRRRDRVEKAGGGAVVESEALRAAQVRVARLERRVLLFETFDALIEECRADRRTLERSLAVMLPRAVELLNARGAFVRTLDERLHPHVYRAGDFPPALEPLVPESFVVDPPTHVIRGTADGEPVLLLRALDCAGEHVGAAGFAFAGPLEGEDLEVARDEVKTVCETLDNFLELITAAAHKQKLMIGASEALRNAVLSEGSDRALDLLMKSLQLSDAALVYANRDARGRGRLHYRIYHHGKLAADADTHPDEEIAAALEARGLDVLDAADPTLGRLLGERGLVEAVLINGLTERRPIGKLIVRTSHDDGLDPEGMDVLHLFAECLSQRLVDYNRERRNLARFFPPAVVNTLLNEPRYHELYLSAREEEIAILFSDISSFTAISGQLLHSPSATGELIDRWSEGAVRILFENGGVFDKMVGDCVIGLFGPPLFADSLEDRALAATRAAIEIARFTADLGRDHGYTERIRAAGLAPGLGCAAGVNMGPTSVGLFGPNQEYTGFSSAMNNTARVQGFAKFQQVAVMQNVRDLVAPHAAALGISIVGPEQAQAKNGAPRLLPHPRRHPVAGATFPPRLHRAAPDATFHCVWALLDLEKAVDATFHCVYEPLDPGGQPPPRRGFSVLRLGGG